MEAFVERLAEIEERLVTLACPSEGARKIVVLRNALFFRAAFVDGCVRIVVKGIRVERKGMAVCFFRVFVLMISEVSSAEVAVNGGPTGCLYF